MLPMPTTPRWSISTFLTACRDPRRSADRWDAVKSGSRGSTPSARAVRGESRRATSARRCRGGGCRGSGGRGRRRARSAGWSRAPRLSGSGPRLRRRAPVNRGWTTRRSPPLEVEHDELGAAPGALDRRADDARGEGRRRPPRAARPASGRRRSSDRPDPGSRGRGRARSSQSRAARAPGSCRGDLAPADVACDTACRRTRTCSATARLRSRRLGDRRADGAHGEHPSARGDEATVARRAPCRRGRWLLPRRARAGGSRRRCAGVSG